MRKHVVIYSFGNNEPDFCSNSFIPVRLLSTSRQNQFFSVCLQLAYTFLSRFGYQAEQE